MESKHPK
jgi:hypothetical protein